MKIYAIMLISFVCLFLCLYVCVYLFATNRSQLTCNLYRTSHTARHQSKKELIILSRSWGQMRRSRSKQSINLFIQKYSTYTAGQDSKGGYNLR